MCFSQKPISETAFSFLQKRIFMQRSLKMSDDPGSAPLLSYHDHPILEESAKNDEFAADQDSQTRRPSSFSEVVEEMKQLYVIALPMIVTGLLIYGKSAISVHFLGKIGKDTLAGGCLAIGIANITGYSVLSGLSSGMDGISSQACGARQWLLMGQTLQRTIMILILACIPISILWLSFEPILLVFGQNPTISSIATTYLAFSIPDLLFQSLINPLKIYLRTQNVTLPLMLSAALALVLHFPINYVIVNRFSIGIRGVALAAAFTDLILLAIVLLYLWLSGACSKAWQGWSYRCFNEWKPILRQAIPSCISVCLEWWWYEILILLSGFLPRAADTVATSGIIIQATALIYNFPVALSLAVSTRVGIELGANQPMKAKTSSLTALVCAVVTGLVAMLFMVTMRNAWGRYFTEDVAILSLTAAALPVVGLCELGNCPQTTICGVLRGSARPTLGAKINFVSFYCVGLPISALMGFKMNLGLLGLWLGLLAAQVVCAVAMMIVLTRTDWKSQAERAKELTGGTDVSNEDNNAGPDGRIPIVLLN